MADSTARNKRLWMRVAVGYAVCLHLFLGLLIFETDLVPKLKSGSSGEPLSHFQNMLIYHGWGDDSVPDNAVIFLGDSITQGLATAAVAPHSVNYGIGGETTTQLLEALPSYRSLNRARAIVLAIGINDIVGGKQKGLKERYNKIVGALPRGTPLVWSAVMPVKVATWMKMEQSDITEANREIKLLCEMRGNCVFVNTVGLLGDTNGQIVQRYYLDDGVHLSHDGYRQWISALKQAIDSPPGGKE